MPPRLHLLPGALADRAVRTREGAGRQTLHFSQFQNAFDASVNVKQTCV